MNFTPSISIFPAALAFQTTLTNKINVGNVTFKKSRNLSKLLTRPYDFQRFHLKNRHSRAESPQNLIF